MHRTLGVFLSAWGRGGEIGGGRGGGGVNCSEAFWDKVWGGSGGLWVLYEGPNETLMILGQVGEIWGKW